MVQIQKKKGTWSNYMGNKGIVGEDQRKIPVLGFGVDNLALKSWKNGSEKFLQK